MESFSGGGDGERDAIFEKDGAQFGNGGRAGHIGHRVVDGADCGARIDACVFVYRADFGHS